MRITIFILLALSLALILQRPQPQTQILPRSCVSEGNVARLQRTMEKARRGDPITIGFIGGSITVGERATTPDRQYANRVTQWWVEHFPQSTITMVNAGVLGTGSNYGCLRVNRDLLSHHPDFVVVEFGVNDRDDLAHAETYEGVVRQLMADPHDPAVILLFMMHHDGTNAQALQSEIGLHYQLPMISFRDAVWPKIVSGRMQVSDVLADTVHPNDRGHSNIASFINIFLEGVFNDPPERAIDELPPPRFTDLFAKTKLIEAADLQPVISDGWKYDSGKHCWVADQPGSVIEFNTSGQLIDLLYNRVTPDGGTAAVTVDDGPTVLCDSWFDGSWAGHCQTDVAGRDLSPAIHRVKIELTSQQNTLSHGHEFQILGLGSSGN